MQRLTSLYFIYNINMRILAEIYTLNVHIRYQRNVTSYDENIKKGKAHQ